MTGTREVFTFGDFELDVEVGELRRENRRLKLQPQPFKLLLLLVRKGGALVTRDEIRRELWPDGTFVDFDQAVNFSNRFVTRWAMRPIILFI
jgi:DNA-binding winged helix-turn-helix (wHTH) protein